jgi:hypothetical protein
MSDTSETSPPVPQSPRTKKRFRERTAATRAAFHRALHRSAAPEPAAAISPEERAAQAATEQALDELRTELSFERKQVLEPLLHRLQEFAERLGQGENVPAKLLDEALNLWQAYDDRLHDEHIHQLVAIGAAGAPPSEMEPTLGEIEQDPPRARARVGEVRAMLVAYAEGYRVFGGLISPALHGNTVSELAWEQLEEEFVQNWHPRPLSAVAMQHLRASLDATRTAAGKLRQEIDGFLDRTVRFGPAGTTVSGGLSPRSASPVVA